MLSKSHRTAAPALPQLIFGEHQAPIAQGFYSMADQFSHLTPGCDYDSKAKNGFIHKGNAIRVNDITINQNYYSHMLAVSAVRENNILIPLAGTHHGIWRGQPLQACKNQGFFIPANDKFQFETDLEGVAGSLIISYDLDRFNRVLQSMTGNAQARAPEDQVRHLQLTHGNIQFKKMFINLLLQIDILDSNIELLTLNGFEDQFYRILVTTLYAKHFLNVDSAQKEQQIARKWEVITAFERYVADHIDQTIVLSELENQLGITSRALQYACMKKHGCSPRTYIRNKKLEMAYQRLRQESGNIKITDLAFDLGFSSQSQFSKFFRERFGLLPSQL